jgi:hypothetical protein
MAVRAFDVEREHCRYLNGLRSITWWLRHFTPILSIPKKHPQCAETRHAQSTAINFWRKPI